MSLVDVVETQSPFTTLNQKNQLLQARAKTTTHLFCPCPSVMWNAARSVKPRSSKSQLNFCSSLDHFSGSPEVGHILILICSAQGYYDSCGEEGYKYGLHKEGHL